MAKSPKPQKLIFLMCFLHLTTGMATTPSNSEIVFNGFTNSNLVVSGIAQITSNGLLLTSYSKEDVGRVDPDFRSKKMKIKRRLK
jgi:hypothetical protein